MLKKGKTLLKSNDFSRILVRVAGFEPTASWTRISLEKDSDLLLAIFNPVVPELRHLHILSAPLFPSAHFVMWVRVWVK